MRKSIIRPSIAGLSVVLTAIHHMDAPLRDQVRIGQRGTLEYAVIKPEIQAPQGSYVMAGKFVYLDGGNNRKEVILNYGSFTPTGLGDQLRISWAIFKAKVHDALGTVSSCH